MVDTAPVTAASSIPQPGDGAYLARPTPQPGDGAYLAQRPNSGPSRGPRNNGRGRGRKPGNAAHGSFSVHEPPAAQIGALTLDPSPNGGPRSARGKGRNNGPRPNGTSDGPHRGRNRPQRQRGEPVNGVATPSGSSPSTPLNPTASVFNPEEGGLSRPSSRGSQSKSRQRKPKTEADGAAAPKPVSSRRAAFERGTKLTTGDAPPKKEKAARKHVDHPEPLGPEPDDLNSRLTRGLRGKPFLECPICFNPIFSQQQTWSCLPPHSPPEYPKSLEENERPAFATAHYTACYTPFHINCVRDWASRSLHDDAERIRKSESKDEPSWRCPGCQKHRALKIGGYRCFCGRLANPPTNTSAPHSCNDACARTRPNCSHPCPLNCHPGPCPPCQVALVVRCPSHASALTVKCSTASTNDAALTPVCDEICDRELGCGKHRCENLCHFGSCGDCGEVDTVRCYCGEEDKVVPCGWNKKESKVCSDANETWEGRFACDRVCSKKYECGIHECLEKCHPHPSSPIPCPTSPSVITTCPCGATPLNLLPGYPRPDCTAPIPICGEACPKSRPCGHACPLKCHTGECPPCHEQVYRPCRCGENTLLLDCDEVRERQQAGETEFLCDRVCKALRNCGRHECGRVCCPLSYKAKRKGRRALDLDFDNDDLHQCPLVCGKLLSCGIHACPKPDHKGACGRCLQASYDELICNCGHTVVYPPVACGTKVNCVFPCARPDPPCGHPKTPHNCHEEPDCPPCPFLTAKPCACGKDPAVKNIRCSQSQDRVSCGQVCGKLLGCGYHRCEKTCHPGECESCTQTCNKPKRICKHACSHTCHAPAKCPENEGCSTIVIQTCSCGNLQTRTTCGSSTSNPSSRETAQLKCNADCMMRQRNARLADALGIKQPIDRTLTEWPPELRSFALANLPFVKTVENTFRDFVNGTRQTVILPHMPAAKRTFVMSMADVYRLGRELIDAEPNRSVQIRRRVDTRLPNPLLSTAVQPAPSKLGGLGNLRASPAGVWGGSRSGTASPSTAASAAKANTPTASGPSSRVPSPGAEQSRPTPPESSRVHVPVTHTHVPVQTVGVVGDTDWDQSGDEAD
ncbi:hypothetical protein CcaverHIS631_0310300 [Cutaneotrichosporon cavernicola]|nr:hypothetical protein CcaverHIS631_0310300 [Cutaneotrichosporon cavernicola]BEJ06503.1 hypothetical protein CcaverHIS641_0310250 [Cutaneotrichosporon cavernicola]